MKRSALRLGAIVSPRHCARRPRMLRRVMSSCRTQQTDGAGPSPGTAPRQSATQIGEFRSTVMPGTILWGDNIGQVAGRLLIPRCPSLPSARGCRVISSGLSSISKGVYPAPGIRGRRGRPSWLICSMGVAAFPAGQDAVAASKSTAAGIADIEAGRPGCAVRSTLCARFPSAALGTR